MRLVGGWGGGAGDVGSRLPGVVGRLILHVDRIANLPHHITGMTDPLRDCAPYGQLLRAVAPARLLLGRPDVQATLPPAIDAFLSASL